MLYTFIPLYFTPFYVSTYSSARGSAYGSARSSTRGFACSSIYSFTCVSARVSTHTSAYISLRLPICLFTCLIGGRIEKCRDIDVDVKM